MAVGLFVSHLLNSVSSYLSLEVLPTMQQLVLAPLNHPNMLWMTIPLIIITLAMTFYFGRYVEETLGWNTAFGNSLVLFFVALDLLRELMRVHSGISLFSLIFLPKFIIVLVIGAFSLILAALDFFHKMPEDIAFFVSAPLSLNLIAYLSMAIVYADVPLNPATIISALIIFLCLSATFYILKLLLPDKAASA